MNRTVHARPALAAFALALIALAPPCRADTVTVASAGPYGKVCQDGPVTAVDMDCGSILNWIDPTSGCSSTWSYFASAQCYTPQANPNNWPNDIADLITYNAGTFSMFDETLFGQTVCSMTLLPFPDYDCEDDNPTASASASGMRVLWSWTEYTGQTCQTKDVGLSESRLWHVMGSSPREWAVARRLSRALELIETTDMAVKEIAYTVGFKHQSHFTRVFREVFGRPPLQYRLAMAAQQENAIL